MVKTELVKKSQTYASYAHGLSAINGNDSESISGSKSVSKNRKYTDRELLGWEIAHLGSFSKWPDCTANVYDPYCGY